MSFSSVLTSSLMEVRRALELACHALIACLTVIAVEYLGSALELVFMGAPAAPRKGVSLTNAPLTNASGHWLA